jgi:aconitate hydratase
MTRVDKARENCWRPLTLTEKILYNHLWDGMPSKAFTRGAIMLILLQIEWLVKMQPLKWRCYNLCIQVKLKWQFLQRHCDHLIQAKVDAVTDLAKSKTQSNEVLNFFLQCLINGDGFWKPGQELFTGSA